MSAATCVAGASADAPVRFCLDCGIEIPAKRLVAKPSAIRCVGCQEDHDEVMREPRTDLQRLAFVSSPNSDDLSFSGRRRKTVSTGGITSIMASTEETAGQATNTGHRVISIEGREAMTKLNWSGRRR